MKKVLMLALIVFGTSAIINAQTAPVQAHHVKEVKMGKHKKEVEKPETKKVESKKIEHLKR
jgi:hypothetical protein